MDSISVTPGGILGFGVAPLCQSCRRPKCGHFEGNFELDRTRQNNDFGSAGRQPGQSWWVCPPWRKPFGTRCPPARRQSFKQGRTVGNCQARGWRDWRGLSLREIQGFVPISGEQLQRLHCRSEDAIVMVVVHLCNRNLLERCAL